ncbi:hypothetical protein FD755_004768, partial [Muntiacus reevesi]
IKAKLFTWNILKTVALGQMLSLCICGAAIISQYLAERYKVNTLMLQSLINYCLLFLIYTVMLAFQSYILLGLVDAEANYVTGRAYQYRTLTSVQVAQVFAPLDCFVIPVLMALSEFILYTRYRVICYLAVAVGLLDIGTMVGLTGLISLLSKGLSRSFSSTTLFHSPLSPSSRGSLVPLHFLPLGWRHLHI